MTKERTARVNKTPKKDDGTIDKEAVKLLYLASKHIAWTPFAKEQGLDPNRSRSDFPVSEWISEKKENMQKLANENYLKFENYLSNNYFANSEKGFVKCNKILEKSSDLILKLIDDLSNSKDYSMDHIKIVSKISNEHIDNYKKLYSIDNNLLRFSKNSEQIIDQSMEQNTGPVVFGIMTPGGKELNSNELAELLASYYDKPYNSNDELDSNRDSLTL